MSRAEFPPVVSLLLEEPPPAGDLADIKRWFRRLSPELRRQARWTESYFEYPQLAVSPTSMVAAPSGGLDPFRSAVTCSNPACRLKSAREFARTIGLYAEHSVVVDEFSAKLTVMPKFSEDQVIRFAVDVAVLYELRPLLDAGIVSFRTPFGSFCEEHFDEFMSSAREVADQVLDDLHIKPKARVVRDGILVDFEPLYGYPLVLVKELSPTAQVELGSRKRREALIRRIFRKEAESVVKDTLLNLNEASQLNATLLSASRVSMLAMRKLDDFPYAPADRELWESSRSLELPWVTNLSVAQVVELRELAAEALPKLREQLGGVLRGDETSSESVAKRIQHLREEAADVRAELVSLRRRHETTFRNVAGILGVTIALYGFSGGFVPPSAALASLMTLFGLLHASEHKQFADVQRVKSKPGYVLVQAKRLLSHADKNDG